MDTSPYDPETKTNNNNPPNLTYTNQLSSVGCWAPSIVRKVFMSKPAFYFPKEPLAILLFDQPHGKAQLLTMYMDYIAS